MAKLKDIYDQELARKELHLKGFRDSYQAYKDFYQSIMDIIPEDMECEYSIDFSSFNVNLSGDKETLVKLVRILRRMDLKPDDRPLENDTHWSTYWRAEEYDDKKIYIYFCSTQCKRVVVGSEMIKRPIYEIQCDGGSMTDLADAATEA